MTCQAMSKKGFTVVIAHANYRPLMLSNQTPAVEAVTLKVNEEQACIDWLLMVKEHLTEDQ